MKNIFSIAIVIFLCSCARKHAAKEKEKWVFAFKAEACSSCLGNMNVKIDNDISPSLRMEVLGPVYMKKADSIGREFTAQINENSDYLKDTDLAAGKAISNGCLLLFSSKELNSAAENIYKESQDK